jgi:hypothetical protein
LNNRCHKGVDFGEVGENADDAVGAEHRQTADNQRQRRGDNATDTVEIAYFHPRSQRFSALIDDGVVKQLNIEQGGAFEVSNE